MKIGFTKYIKNSTLREKPKKGSKQQGYQRYDIREEITKNKHQICYLMVAEVMNLREDTKIDEKLE